MSAKPPEAEFSYGTRGQQTPVAAAADLGPEPVVRRQVLDGLINDYDREAA